MLGNLKKRKKRKRSFAWNDVNPAWWLLAALLATLFYLGSVYGW